MSNASYRAAVLSSLVDKLTVELWPEALNIAREISDESDRVRALSSLADRQPELWPEALNVAREISNEVFRAVALSDLAEPLTEALRLTARTLSLEIQDPYYRAAALRGFLAVETSLWQDLEMQTQNLLRLLTPQERESFIEEVPKLYSHLQCLGGQPAVDATLQAMRDACQQWP